MIPGVAKQRVFTGVMLMRRFQGERPLGVARGFATEARLSLPQAEFHCVALREVLEYARDFLQELGTSRVAVGRVKDVASQSEEILRMFADRRRTGRASRIVLGHRMPFPSETPPRTACPSKKLHPHYSEGNSVIWQDVRDRNHSIIDSGTDNRRRHKPSRPWGQTPVGRLLSFGNTGAMEKRSYANAVSGFRFGRRCLWGAQLAIFSLQPWPRRLSKGTCSRPRIEAPELPAPRFPGDFLPGRESLGPTGCVGPRSRHTYCLCFS